MRNKRRLVLTVGASVLIAMAGFLGACNDDDNDNNSDLGDEIQDVGDAIGDEIDDAVDAVDDEATPTLTPQASMQPAGGSSFI